MILSDLFARFQGHDNSKMVQDGAIVTMADQ